MTWWTYVERITAPDDQKTIASKAGIDQSSVSRWKKTNKPGRVESVSALARGYGRPVLEAFVAAGFITEREAKVRPVAQQSLDSITDDQLIELVAKRLKERDSGGNTAAIVELAKGSGKTASLAQRAADEQETSIEAEWLEPEHP